MRIGIDGCEMILLKTFRFFVYSCFILFIIFLGGNIYWLVVSDGYGFGLATVKKIIAAHGGNIWIDSEVKDGARFVFELPR